jgi:hypothetical protein
MENQSSGFLAIILGGGDRFVVHTESTLLREALQTFYATQQRNVIVNHSDTLATIPREIVAEALKGLTPLEGAKTKGSFKLNFILAGVPEALGAEGQSE